jgi:hypothetical protein
MGTGIPSEQRHMRRIEGTSVCSLGKKRLLRKGDGEVEEVREAGYSQWTALRHLLYNLSQEAPEVSPALGL